MASHRKPSAQTYDPRTVKEHIVETPLNEEMSKSFLEYAYSVIYARALPDARDGLKPVQRRIVYQMGEMNLTPDRPYMKSARVVGEVMGKLHPHGDSAIYEAMVRLAQPFAMRLPLVDGHGNFGSLDDGPAASRYTEARLGPAALGMNADIDEDTVDFTPNYDNKLKEPTVLPAAIPNLLVNGGSGIAVGMATNLATHNLGEVVNAAKFLMAHSDATLEQPTGPPAARSSAATASVRPMPLAVVRSPRAPPRISSMSRPASRPSWSPSCRTWWARRR